MSLTQSSFDIREGAILLSQYEYDLAPRTQERLG